jgi:hypothetical protein
MDWGLEDNSLESQSGITGDTQTSATPYALWNFDFTIPKMDWDEAGPWVSFFAQLRGKTGSFKLPVPGVDAPRSGYAGAVGVVDGASQLGYTLNTKNWANEATLLNVGDLFTVNDELKVVRIVATSGVTGLSTITFDPPLRSSPANLAPIVISNPYVVLASKVNLPKWKTGTPMNTKFNMTCRERP